MGNTIFKDNISENVPEFVKIMSVVWGIIRSAVRDFNEWRKSILMEAGERTSQAKRTANADGLKWESLILSWNGPKSSLVET